MTNKLSNTAKQQFWNNHIEEWTASGLTQVEYCRLHGISIKSFEYWKRKSKNTSAPALVEVPLPKSFSIPLSYPQLCLVIGRNYRIEIGKGFDSEDLERVVRILGCI